MARAVVIKHISGIPGNAFVPVNRSELAPLGRIVYVLTDMCVVLVACPVCKARKGKLCRGRDGQRSATHYRRNQEAKALRGKMRKSKRTVNAWVLP